MSEYSCSAFYNACCTGDMKIVASCLATMKAHEISRLEPNGSTALHAAASNGHEQIVKLLLKRRCSRSVRDSSNKAALDIAVTSSIRALLKRPIETRRYEAEAIEVEWITDNFDGIWANLLNPGRLFECSEDSKEQIKARQNCVIQWLEAGMEDEDEKNVIIEMLKESFESESAIQLLQAYTEETSFYTLLNRDLAKVPTDNGFAQSELHPALIIARSLFRCAYYGRHTGNSSATLFRAAKYTEDEIQKYKDHVEKGPFKTKTLWSTAKSRESAATTVPKYNVMLILTSRDKRSRRTIDLSTLSAFPDEEEVLVVPLTCMQVTKIEPIGDGKHEIHLTYWDW